MTLIEITQEDPARLRQYRLGHFLTLLVAGAALLYGLNLRSGILNATVRYSNVEVGIAASYPQNWLIDFDGDYVFRVRDMTRIGYKTTMQIALRPIGPNMTARNVLDTLNITRPETLSRYDPLSIEQTILADDTPATVMTYTFVDADPNPFLESLPTVVTGRDILAIRGGQVIIMTFRSDASTFDEDVAVFERMLRSVEF